MISFYCTSDIRLTLPRNKKGAAGDIVCLQRGVCVKWCEAAGEKQPPSLPPCLTQHDGVAAEKAIHLHLHILSAQFLKSWP